MTDQKIRSPNEIFLYCAAILHKMGLPLKKEEMLQFKPYIDEELITFILLKQQEIENEKK